MVADERLHQILYALTRATEQKLLNWERTDPSEVRTRLPGGEYVRLIREDASNILAVGGHLPYLALTLVDAFGQVIEQWQPADREDWDQIDSLYRLIRRTALGVDKKLQQVVEALESILAAPPK